MGNILEQSGKFSEYLGIIRTFPRVVITDSEFNDVLIPMNIMPVMTMMGSIMKHLRKPMTRV